VLKIKLVAYKVGGKGPKIPKISLPLPILGCRRSTLTWADRTPLPITTRETGNTSAMTSVGEVDGPEMDDVSRPEVGQLRERLYRVLSHMENLENTWNFTDLEKSWKMHGI